MANDGHAGAGNNSYPGNGANPNIQNSNMMIQGQGQGQDQEQGQVPYGYNEAAWYHGTLDYGPAMDTNVNMNGDYYFNDLHTPPPATIMNLNRYNDGYDFNESGTPHPHPPFFPVQHQLGPQPVFDAKFFVIKSNSRENVVSSIKHRVWTSTRRGNKILNAAYREARRHEHSVILFFSVIL